MRCPKCNSARVMHNGYSGNYRKYKCSNRECRKQFSETSAMFAARVTVAAPPVKSVQLPLSHDCINCGKVIRGGYRKVYNGKQHFDCNKPNLKPFKLFQSARTGALIR